MTMHLLSCTSTTECAVVSCSFREIVNKLKGMAQALRPLPKRRPSQIATQASAGSSQPSSAGPLSQPNNGQLPNIKECTALAVKAPIPSANAAKPAGSIPASAASTAATAVSTPDGAACTPKTEPFLPQAPADAAAGETSSSQQEAHKVLNQDSEPAARTCEQQAKPEAAVKQPVDKSRKSGPDDYVSPFEQAQESAAAPAQVPSPFANSS